jgi:CheY-like chemotaxis protein
MRLELMPASLLQHALQLYAAQAWPLGAPPRAKALLGALAEPATLEQLLARFEREETHAQCEGRELELARYTLRLGNARYLFMKFVLQEHLVEGEFFCSVDTHDKLDVRPNAPDYAAWEELKHHNRQLKARIEAAWAQAGVPTLQQLQALCTDVAGREKGAPKRARLLVIDDEVSVARGLQALLEARGYEVELAHDGAQALARLARDPLPALVLLDYEMPQLDGKEVLARMRADPRLAELPVLFATASSIELERLERASGFLRKPYPRQVLFALLERLVPPASASEAARA